MLCASSLSAAADVGADAAGDASGSGQSVYAISTQDWHRYVSPGSCEFDEYYKEKFMLLSQLVYGPYLNINIFMIKRSTEKFVRIVS